MRRTGGRYPTGSLRRTTGYAAVRESSKGNTKESTKTLPKRRCACDWAVRVKVVACLSLANTTGNSEGIL